MKLAKLTISSLLLDEAGFEILANTDESSIASKLYTERAYVLARGFIQRALKVRPGSVVDIIDWLYCNPRTGGEGPDLLRTVIEEARARITNLVDVGKGSEEGPVQKLSSGASMTLERTVAWLEMYREGRVEDA